MLDIVLDSIWNCEFNFNWHFIQIATAAVLSDRLAKQAGIGTHWCLIFVSLRMDTDGTEDPDQQQMRDCRCCHYNRDSEWNGKTRDIINVRRRRRRRDE